MFRTSLCLLAILVVIPPAWSEDIYGITTQRRLVRFDSASPGTFSVVGQWAVLPNGQILRSIDARPSDGQLYGVGYNGTTEVGQLYRFGLGTADLTAVGSPFTLTGNGNFVFSADFDPVADSLRILSSNTQRNWVLNPNTGVLVQQTNLAYDPSSPAQGPVDPLTIAYSNNVAGATSTTPYAYSFSNDAFLRIGSIGGTPLPASSGVSFSVGFSGLLVSDTGIGFDISGQTGIAYFATGENAPQDVLYTVDLGTGAITSLGSIGGLTINDIAVQIAAVPEPAWLTTGTVAALGFVGLAMRRRVRRRARK